LKLAWPDKIDRRRKQKNYQAILRASTSNYITQDGNFTFLNTTPADVSGQKLNIQNALHNEMRLAPAMLPIYNINDQDGLLLSYCMAERN